MNYLNYLRHRSNLNRQILLTLSLGVVLAVVLMASGPLIVDTVLDLNLLRRLSAVDPQDSNLRIVMMADPDRALFQQHNEDVSRLVENRLGSQIEAVVTSGSTRWAYPWFDESLLNDQRVNLRFYDTDESQLLSNSTWFSGDWPTEFVGDQSEINGVIGLAASTAYGLDVGNKLPISTGANAEEPDFWVSVSGVLAPTNDNAPYWFGSLSPYRSHADVRNTAQYNILVSDELFFETAARAFHSSKVELAWHVILNPDSILARDSAELMAQIDALETDLDGLGQNIQLQTGITEILGETVPQTESVRAPLYFLLAAVVLLSLYYVTMVATLSVRQSKREFAVLRSRGSSSSQLFGLQFIEAAVISIVAIISGPGLAQLITRAMVFTGPLSDLVDSDWSLPLSISSWTAATIGALACLIGLLGPVPGAIRRSIVSHASGLSRTEQKPWWQRFYLDVFLMIIGLILLWRLRIYGGILGDEEARLGVDWLLLLSPLALLLGGATITLRVFPPLLNLGARMVSRAKGLPAALALWQAARDPVHVARLVLLLTLAMALGLLSNGLNAALDQNEQDRANYAVGSDLRAMVNRREIGERGVIDTGLIGESVPGISSMTPAIRTTGSLQMTIENAHPEFDLLGVTPQEFIGVTYLRADYANTSIAELLEQLQSRSREVTPISLPGKPSRFGAWMLVPFSGVSTLSPFAVTGSAEPDEVWLTAKFRTAQDELFSLPLKVQVAASGSTVADVSAAGWQFVGSDLPKFSDSSYPLELVSLWISKQESFNFAYSMLPQLALDDLTIVEADTGETKVIENFESNDLQWRSSNPGLMLQLAEGYSYAGEKHLLLDYGWHGISASQWISLSPTKDVVERIPTQPLPADEQAHFSLVLSPQAHRIGLWISAPISGEYRIGPDEVIRVGQLEDLTVSFGFLTPQNEEFIFDSNPPDLEAPADLVTTKLWGFFEIEIPMLPDESYPLELTSIILTHAPGTIFPILELDDLTIFDQPGENVIASFDGDAPPYWRVEGGAGRRIQSGSTTGFARTFFRIWSLEGEGFGDLGALEMSPKSEEHIFQESEPVEDVENLDLSLGILPVLVSSQFLEITQVELGDHVGAWIDSRPFQLEVVGEVQYFPTLSDTQQAGFVITNQDDVLGPINAVGPESLNANEYFISTEPGATSAVAGEIQAAMGDNLELLDAEDLRKTIKSDPLALGLRSITTLGYILTSLLSLVGFGSYFYVSVRQRRKNYAVLRALGMSARQLYGSLVLEQIVLIFSGLGLGTGLGLLLNQLTLPGLPLTLGGQPPVPPFIASTDWVGVVSIYLTLSLAFLIMLAAATFSLSRTRLHRILRVDEE
jgi:ABC-type antimicrobial peptide transport system permease subunit